MVWPKMCLNSGWLAARASSVPFTGYELTTLAAPSLDSLPWMEGEVPGTVLTTLLKNKLIPDPFYGFQNEEVVDISVAGREHYTFWFYKAFKIPQLGEMRAWLQFRAVNYSAQVFLNGNRHSIPGGMFMRHSIDVTDWLKPDEENKLAVIVFPPDHPGQIPPEGGQGGDHDIAKDVAAQYVEGWDWMIPIRDRNTGMWDEVLISYTGPVKLSDPHLISTLHNNFESANLHATVCLENVSRSAVDCKLKVQVILDMEDGVCSVEHVHSENVNIPGGESIQHTIRPLAFSKPRLWWPNGVGEQPLYQVDIVVEVQSYGDSDCWSGYHGFRQIKSLIDPLTGGRRFEVNGEPLFIRGANWIVSDGLLRLSEKRYRADIRFHRDMNLNMIRVWGGALAERPLFYEACDEYGLLVWQEFWITGDCNGRGVEPSDHNWPLDHNLFLECARDTVKLLRNHASLALWVGGNEQFPPDDINAALKEELVLHPAFRNFEGSRNPGGDDPSTYLDGSRLYIQGSLWDGFAKGNGDFADGPYGIQNPEDFFKDGFYPYAFNPEIGSVGVPVSATMRMIMPCEALEPPVAEVASSIWDYHKYIPYADAEKKVADQISLYGEPRDLDDFCDKAQLANYVQYRALVESWNARMWTQYTGVLIWKSQNPWPGLRGQLYDHLLDQNGGFFGVMSAAEPIHVQLNLSTYFVQVVNTSRNPLQGFSVHAEIWDVDGECTYQDKLEQVNAQPWQTTDVLEIRYHRSSNPKPVYFLLLKLMNSGDKLVSRNFYWLHQPHGDYRLLQGDFKSRKVPIKAQASASVKHGMCTLKVNISNLARIHASSNDSHAPSSTTGSTRLPNDDSQHRSISRNKHELEAGGVAFWLHFSVLSEKSGRVLPTFYTHNYFSLVPQESLGVDISFQVARGLPVDLILQGWNIETTKVCIQDVHLVNECVGSKQQQSSKKENGY